MSKKRAKKQALVMITSTLLIIANMKAFLIINNF